MLCLKARPRGTRAYVNMNVERVVMSEYLQTLL